MNGWIDDSDLPKLQSIRLDFAALAGDDCDDCALWDDALADRQTIRRAPYNYKNTLTMRSGIKRKAE